MPLTSTLPVPLASASAIADGRATRRDAIAQTALIDTRRWVALAIGSLVVAGLLSLAVVIGRLPVLSRIIDDPLFFKRCLVVHVDLALVVWFYAFLGGLLAMAAPAQPGRVRTFAYLFAVGGVLAMLAGALVRGAQPVLANYVPVIAHPLFSAGLAAFFVGALLHFVHSLAAPATDTRGALPPDATLGLKTASVIIVIAAATWVSAQAGLPAGLDVATRAEFLAWGPGHVLQAANACAMLAVWLWLLERATGTPVLSRRAAQLVFGALVLPQAVMPLLTLRGTLDTLYHSGATQLMRWSIFPAVLAVFVLGLAHLRRHRTPASALPAERLVALAGLAASAGLALLGMILGACIRGSTTLVPAHYHASLGAVTVAFMTAAYFVCDRVRGGTNLRVDGRFRALMGAATKTVFVAAPIKARSADRPTLDDRVWRSARRQLAVFGVGQSVFALGFAIGGAYGLGRKTYAAEQHVRSAGEVTGLIVMGLGGLVAVVGGLWFLALVLRELRGWWRTPLAPTATPNEFSTLTLS